MKYTIHTEVGSPAYLQLYKQVREDIVQGIYPHNTKLPSKRHAYLRWSGEKERYIVEDNIVHVSVGSVHHPMEEAHCIQWVYLQTDKGGHRKCLEIGKEPTVRFALVDEKPIAAYAYCNQHGLWKTDI